MPEHATAGHPGARPGGAPLRVVHRKARPLPISPADAALIGAALQAAEADKRADPVTVALPMLAALTPAAREAIRTAHVDDVIATGLRTLGAVQKALAVASLSTSRHARENTRAAVRALVEAL